MSNSLKKCALTYWRWPLLIFILGTFLRFYHINFQSLWYEELETLRFVLRGESFFDFLWLYFEDPDFHPPAVPILLRLIYQITGAHEFALKFIPALCGSLSILVLYKIGAKYFNKNTGLISSLLLALSGSQVYYSQEVRYTPILILGCLLFYYFARVLKDVPSRRNFIFVILLGTVSSYVHYSGFFFSMLVLITLSGFNFENKKLLKKYAICAVGILLLFGPWLPHLLFQAGQWSIYRPYNQNPNILVYFFKMFEFAFLYQMYWQGVPEIVSANSLMIFWAGVVIIILALLSLKLSKPKEGTGNEGLSQFRKLYPIIVFWALPIFLYFLKDATSEKKAFYEKALIFIVPFLYLSLAYTFNLLIEDKKMKGLVTLYCSCLFIFQPFINNSFYSNIFKTEFREVFLKIKSTPGNHDIVYACGQPGWYQFYTEKYGLNEHFLKREGKASSLEDVLKGKFLPGQSFWVVWGSCQPKEELLRFLERSNVIESTSLSTQAVGLLIERNF